MISTELKTQIQGAYSRFLESKSLKPRYGQRLMIAEVAKVLGDIDTDEENHRSGDPAVVAVEAGTGTEIGRATRLNSSHYQQSRMPSSA